MCDSFFPQAVWLLDAYPGLFSVLCSDSKFVSDLPFLNIFTDPYCFQHGLHLYLYSVHPLGLHPYIVFFFRVPFYDRVFVLGFFVNKVYLLPLLFIYLFIFTSTVYVS